MDTIDSSIPLAAGNIAANGQNSLLTMFDFAQKIQDQRKATMGQNALKQILSDPNSVDPQTRLPTPQAIAGLMAVDPDLGMKIQQETLEQQVKRAQIAHEQSEAGKTSFATMTAAAGAYTDTYDEQKKLGKSDAEADSVATLARNELVNNNGGTLTNEKRDQIIGSKPDINTARTFAMANKEYAATKHQERSDDLREAHDNAMERHGDQMIGAMLAGREDTGWQVLTDPKNNTQYRYNPRTGKATSLDGSQDYAPGGAQKIGGGAGARSAASAAVNKFIQEHPDATAEDVAQFAADFGKTVKSVAAFSTGKQGDMIRSFNVSISHLNTLDNLVDALNNGDVKAFNKLGNAVAEQTGKAAPKNFDAAKSIVGDEIIKAIIGGGGALADRENAQNQIDRAGSPEQLRGVINTYKDLMAGQLKGLKKQYGDTTGRDDFDSRLSDETKKQLEGHEAANAGVAAPTSKAEYDALPAGTQYSKPGDAPGTYRVKQ